MHKHSKVMRMIFDSGSMSTIYDVTYFRIKTLWPFDSRQYWEEGGVWSGSW